MGVSISTATTQSTQSRTVPEPVCVTIPEAARLLSCTVRAVRELLWARKIPYLRVGKRFVIPVEEIRAYVRRVAS